jgi:hypothetical protein
MLRHLPVPRLAHRTIAIRVDYLVRVISLLLLIGLLTSCVPEEDAAELTGVEEVAVENGDDYLRIGDVQILWGSSTSSTVTFSTPFTETPVITTAPTESFCNGAIRISDNATHSGKSKMGFSYPTCNSFDWQAIGKYK